MRTEELNYELPESLIAQYPAQKRSMSRLLVMDRRLGTLADRLFSDIIEYLRPGDCLVMNNTRVLPARFFARRHTGAQLEGLFLSDQNPGTWEVMLKNARRIKEGEVFTLLDHSKQDYIEIKALKRLPEGHWLLECQKADTLSEEILFHIGYAPLPPYIKRTCRPDDKEVSKEDLKRYQTVYAQTCGAVAAPTAGLHFTEELLSQITNMGIDLAYVTLHVGAGTFKPVSTKTLGEHKIHSEFYHLDEHNAEIINNAKSRGGRIIAVGTTTVRTLETIASKGLIQADSGSTRLFIMPGYEFRIIDTLITNFHLPKSTLIALVSAFAGLDHVLASYKHAVDKEYRFYSYGDAMFIF